MSTKYLHAMFRIALRRSCQILTIPTKRSQKTTTSEIRFRKFCGTPITVYYSKYRPHSRANNDMK